MEGIDVEDVLLFNFRNRNGLKHEVAIENLSLSKAQNDQKVLFFF